MMQNPLMEALIAGGGATNQSHEPGYYISQAMEMSAARARAEERAAALDEQRKMLAGQDRTLHTNLAGAAFAFHRFNPVNRAVLVLGYATVAYGVYRFANAMGWVGRRRSSPRRRVYVEREDD